MNNLLTIRIEKELNELSIGHPINRATVIKLLTDSLISLRTNGTLRNPAQKSDNFTVEPEQTPERKRVKNWGLGECKRCLTNDVQDGDIIVKILGKGWWHDACYRIVNPSFYQGM